MFDPLFFGFHFVFCFDVVEHFLGFVDDVVPYVNAAYCPGSRTRILRGDRGVPNRIERIALNQDVVHIGKARFSEHQDTYLKTPSDLADQDYSAAGAPGSGRIDHVCFNCDGINEFIERLNTNGVEFSERKAHNSNLYQLFMREPINGIKVELNFSAAEAVSAGRVPEWTDLGANK